eukprot:5581382-Prymnesium_polylepis.2
MTVTDSGHLLRCCSLEHNVLIDALSQMAEIRNSGSAGSMGTYDALTSWIAWTATEVHADLDSRTPIRSFGACLPAPSSAFATPRANASSSA